MSHRHTGRAGRLLLLVTYLSLACKFLIPVGYMPAAIGDGWPVRLCLSGLPENIFSQGSHHHGHEQSDDSKWQTCSFGVMSSAVAVTSDTATNALLPIAAPVQTEPTSVMANATPVAFRSRAPPA